MNNKSLQNYGTGSKFSKILVKYEPSIMIHNGSFGSPLRGNRIREGNNASVRVSALVRTKCDVTFGSSRDHDCKRD